MRKKNQDTLPRSAVKGMNVKNGSEVPGSQGDK